MKTIPHMAMAAALLVAALLATGCTTARQFANCGNAAKAKTLALSVAEAIDKACPIEPAPPSSEE